MKSSKSAAQFSSLFSLGLYLPSYLISYYGWNFRSLSCLSFPIAYREGFTALVDPKHSISFEKSVLFLILDAILLLIITWYLSNVLTTDGSPLNWFFFMTKSGLKKSIGIKNVIQNFRLSSPSFEPIELDEVEENNYDEDLIIIRNLSKKFEKRDLFCGKETEVLAIDDLSMEISRVRFEIFILILNMHKLGRYSCFAWT
jgi:hypothetical protein